MCIALALFRRVCLSVVKLLPGYSLYWQNDKRLVVDDDVLHFFSILAERFKVFSGEDLVLVDFT